MNNIELNHDEDIICPYCNEVLASVAQGEDFQVCKHTVFVASDYGFEYIREDFKDIIELSEKDYINIGSFTTNLNIDGVKFAQYSPGPGWLGVYWGFVKH